MIKILHKSETKDLNNLPLSVAEKVVEIATVLDDNYSDKRAYTDLGGYILIAETVEDVETIENLIDFQYTLPEYVDLITCPNDESYTSTLFLLSSDYSISTIIPLSITPKELLRVYREKYHG